MKISGRNLLLKILGQLNEQQWAHVYHDSIRGKVWLNNLPLNIGRWAGNYAFFYLLNRILNDHKPKEILEFGLGESSKFISTYLENYLTNSSHTIIEQDINWKNSFSERFNLSERCTIKIAPLVINKVKKYETKGFKNIEQLIKKKYDLYIIDAPHGSLNYSRYDIVTLAKKFNKEDQFIIILDDYGRKGEKQTFKDLQKVLTNNEIEINVGYYRGTKEVAVLGTSNYPYIGSL